MNRDDVVKLINEEDTETKMRILHHVENCAECYSVARKLHERRQTNIE